MQNIFFWGKLYLHNIVLETQENWLNSHSNLYRKKTTIIFIFALFKKGSYMLDQDFKPIKNIGHRANFHPTHTFILPTVAKL